ncbi:MAG: hypothetical protein IKW39_02430, partial [Alphaproteobacteria bacterium]|nr:hypothetical protein [Alphaproteobacteria bacterium]
DKRNIIFWMLAFLSTILSAILAKNPLDVAFMPRINFYGLNFLYCGAFAYLLMQKKAVRNLGLVLSIFYMFISVEQNFYAQKVWELGRIAEINQTARILNRLEPKAKHLPLTPVFTDTISLRSKYYHEKYDIKSPYILEKSFTIRHIPSGIYNFYAVSDVFNKTTQISDLTPELEYFLSTSTAIWPDENSIYIDDKYFVIMMTQLGTQAIKSQLPK